MAFTQGNDLNIIQASDTDIVSAGAGNDTYIISPYTIGANQTVTISDSDGTNTLQLVGGLTISSSQVLNNALQLTLSNGAKVNLLNASTFGFDVGGNALAGQTGTSMNYSTFASDVLNVTVPAAGEPAVTTTTPVQIVDGGGTTPPPSTGTFMLTTGTDILIGTAGNDTFTGTADTYAAADADQIVDSSTTDNDTYNLTLSAGGVAPKSANVENVNVTIANSGTAAVSAANMIGVANLTVTRTDLSIGGSTIVGNKQVDVTNLDASKVAKVTAGAGTTIVNVTQATKAGATVDASTATGAVTVVGAATVNADASTGTVTVNRLNDTTEDAKAVTVNAANAATIAIESATTSFTGAITVNAAKASSVTILNATGGATVNAGTTSTADTTIAVSNIDNTGATITTGTGSSTAAEKQIAINLDGTSAATDVATISAAGYISLDANTSDLVETVNLSGNGAAVTYAMVSSVPTTYNLTGNQSVTVSQAAANLHGNTLTDNTTAGTTTAKVTSVATADLSGIAADLIQLSDTGTAAVITVASGANVQVAADQTTSFEVEGKAVGATVNLSTGDDTNASGAAIDIAVDAFTADTNVQTLNLDASTGKFTATSTTLDVAGTDATTLTITGSKNVTLGTTVAKTVNAANLTGALSLTATDGSDTVTAATITGGSAGDSIAVNDADSTTTTFTVDAGAGDNTVTITNAKNNSTFAMGAGSDTVSVAAAGTYVIVTGDGNDTVTATVDSDAIIAMGDGSSDALTLGAQNYSDNPNFAWTGVEQITTAAAGTTKVSAAQFAGDNSFKLVGTSATADIFHVVNTSSTAGATIDASNVTFATSQNAALYLEGAANLADTITGSAKNDMLIASTGADVVNGGEGVDTFNAAALAGATIEGPGTGTSTGVVINLGTSAVTNTSILAATGGFTANSITSVDGGKTAYLFGAAASTNSAVQQTLSSIENVVGTAGRDYIVGSANDNNITGGAGGDYINVGVGTDTVTFAANDTLTGALTTTSAVSVVGADVIAGMGIGDIIALYTAAKVSDGDLASSTTELSVATAGLAALVSGNYDAAAGTFVEGAYNATTANDYLVQWADGTAIHSIVVVDQTAAIKLVGTAATDIFTIAAA